LKTEPSLPPTRVLLLRHAETAAPDLFHGAESDVGLGERGARQVAAIVPLLVAERPALVVSSAMRRAVDTARPIATACAAPLQIEPDLHERRLGPLSRTPTANGHVVWAETLRRWMAGDKGYASPGAESFLDVQQRILPTWGRLAEQCAGATCLVIAHGGIIKVLLLSLDVGLTDWHAFHTPNLGINELVLEDGRWRLLRLAQVPEEVRRA
jgi:2,3-bisphosphoglycerate-dependent phosphoglycerate mutase